MATALVLTIIALPLVVEARRIAGGLTEHGARAPSRECATRKGRPIGETPEPCPSKPRPGRRIRAGRVLGRPALRRRRRSARGRPLCPRSCRTARRSPHAGGGARRDWSALP